MEMGTYTLMSVLMVTILFDPLISTPLDDLTINLNIDDSSQVQFKELSKPKMGRTNNSRTFQSAVPSNDPSISTDQSSYTSGTEMVISFDIGSHNATPGDWIGIYPWGITPGRGTGSTDWQRVCGGHSNCDPVVESGSVTFTTILPGGDWEAWYLVDDGFNYLAMTKFIVTGYDPSISTDQSSYTSGDEMVISFDIGIHTPTLSDWIGIYPWGITPGGTASTDWQRVCGGRPTKCDHVDKTGSVTFTTILPDGDWEAWYLPEDGHNYLAMTKFSVTEFSCPPATGHISPNKHIYAEDGLEASRIAFSSCYKPRFVHGNKFWSHLRYNFRPDLWLWLGDNMYGDGINMNVKRNAYNAARDEKSYASLGPVMEGAKIPVMATWDDHDYGSNNGGKGYVCLKESQKEFVTHFNIPESDPRHPDYPLGQQTGVYNARMLLQPGTKNNGIHVIMMDARSGRDPTYKQHGECQGAISQMLSDTQWAWLDEELNKPSVIKVIASGTQVLSPTDLNRTQSEFCSDDSHSSGSTTTFMDAIREVGEDNYWKGCHYELWGEIPKERAKLLQKAQKSINDGKTKLVVFLSGDQHWAELMAKRMPESPIYGPSQTLYEITGSGIYQKYDEDIPNSNRLRDRTCDHQGSGPYNQACIFPWTYQGVTYTTCEQAPGKVPWCSTMTDKDGNHVKGHWGYCDSMENELAEVTFSNSTRTCTNSKYHICTAEANYGAVEVDFQKKKIKMSIFTPEEEEVAYHQVSY